MKNWCALCLIGVMSFSPHAGQTQEVELRIGDASDSLRQSLSNASLTIATKADDLASAQDFVAAARADYRRLLTALYDQGYFGGTISITLDGQEAAAIAPLDAPKNIARITITVTKGDRFTFGDVNVDPIAPQTMLPDGFTSGQTATTPVIKDAVNTVVTGWKNAGHAKAQAGHQNIVARHNDKSLDVDVQIAQGPRLVFGGLTVTGNNDVRADRINKISGIPIGDVYDPAEIDSALRRLRRTGAFDSVTLTEAEEIAPNNTLPLVISVVESKPRRFGFGVELSSIEGLGVSGYWLHRNFHGGAERFRVEGEISGIGGETGGTDYRIGASLDRPAIYGADTDLFIRTEINRLDEPAYLLDKASFEIGTSRIIGEDLTGELAIGLLTATEKNPAFTRNYSLFTLPFKATLEKRDDLANPKDGYYLQTSLSPFRSFDGNDTGIRTYADARAFRSFGENEQFTIAARGQIGAVYGADIANTPADYLFYSGGGGTVRGQKYNALGVTSTIGGTQVRTGGRSFVGAQIEARYQITDAIGMVGFYDFGQVGVTSDFSNAVQSHAGTGFGMRYNTGIGPIRLDLGTAANGSNAFDNVQIYIGIGQAF